MPWLILLPLLAGAYGCTKKAAPPGPLPQVPQVSGESRARPELLVKAGAAPLWLEFDGEGLRPLSSPEDAALKPLIPWPLAEHAAGIVSWEGGLAIAVNRWGFWLVKDAAGGLFELYFLADKETTPRYTMRRAFTFQGRPAFLLYRDDFFVEHGIPPPAARVLAVKSDVSGLEAVEIPAFSAFPGAEGWDIEDFFTPDGVLWYFKALHKGGGSGKVSYVRAETLSAGGEEIPFDAYIRAAMASAPARQDEAAFPGLPPLPAGFVYTAYSQTGGACIAAWEEREDWNIGAAGLLVIGSGND
ncbi:MAG: hypothetical protein LBO04_04390 [Spirochaetaceae bacterium]|nr:hypothetical protein [Spirochaetaceae bacterium]